MTEKYPGEQTFGETGEQFRRRIAQTEATIEIAEIDAEETRLNYIADEWMARPNQEGIGTGGSRQKMPKPRLRPLIFRCGACGRKQVSSAQTGAALIVVCQDCGGVLEYPELGPPRYAILPSDLAAFMENSHGLGLRHLMEFLLVEPRFLNGDLVEWRDAIETSRKFDRTRDEGDRGAPRLFGDYQSVAVKERLPKSVESELRAHGVGFYRNAPLTFTHACNMAVEMCLVYLTVLRRSPGWGFSDNVTIPPMGAVAPLSSLPEEVAKLIEEIRRPDFGAVVAATLFRKQN